MKAIKDSTMETLESVALEGAKQLKAFFAYQGDNQKYFQKARLGAVAISGYARVRASETNRMALELATRKMSGESQPTVIGEMSERPAPRQLAAGKRTN